MKPKEFVKGLQREVIDANLNIYKDLFDNTKLESIQDKYWVKVLPFYNKLNDNDKKVFYGTKTQYAFWTCYWSATGSTLSKTIRHEWASYLL